MTNREFYAEQILDIYCSGNTVAVDKKTNKPCQCRDMLCANCAVKDNNHDSCRPRFAEWCNAEYVEPCPFDKDELVEVSENGCSWRLRYFAYQKDGKFYCWEGGMKSTETKGVCDWGYCRKYGTLGGLIKEDENNENTKV